MGHIDGSGKGTTPAQRRPSFESEWDNVSVPFRDDPLAPSVSARFGEYIRGDGEANDNIFNLHRGGGVGTLKDGYVRNVPLPRVPREQRASPKPTTPIGIQLPGYFQPSKWIPAVPSVGIL